MTQSSERSGTVTPAWHDVPPVPGDYQVRYTDEYDRPSPSGWSGRLDALSVWRPVKGRKFYGPLPDPPPIPEPPKPPRLFTARRHGCAEELYGIARGDTAVILNGNGSSDATVRVEALGTYYTDIRWYVPETPA